MATLRLPAVKIGTVQAMAEENESGMEKLIKIRLTKEELDSAEAAAIKAGYNPKYARRTGSRLLRTPRIRAAIESLIREREGTDQ